MPPTWTMQTTPSFFDLSELTCTTPFRVPSVLKYSDVMRFCCGFISQVPLEHKGSLEHTSELASCHHHIRSAHNFTFKSQSRTHMLLTLKGVSGTHCKCGFGNTHMKKSSTMRWDVFFLEPCIKEEKRFERVALHPQRSPKQDCSNDVALFMRKYVITLQLDLLLRLYKTSSFTRPVFCSNKRAYSGKPTQEPCLPCGKRIVRTSCLHIRAELIAILKHFFCFFERLLATIKLVLPDFLACALSGHKSPSFRSCVSSMNIVTRKVNKNNLHKMGAGAPPAGRRASLSSTPPAPAI